MCNIGCRCENHYGDCMALNDLDCLIKNKSEEFKKKLEESRWNEINERAKKKN